MYKLAPVSDPAALPAFQELARKMSRQNDFLRHDFNFIPSSGDHYASLKQLRRSIDAQRQAGKRRADMYVYAEPPGPEGNAAQQGHPVFSNDQNVMIRGVHDAIAHLGGNHPFSARGEYGAYNRHLKTLCNVQDARAGGAWRLRPCSRRSSGRRRSTTSTASSPLRRPSSCLTSTTTTWACWPRLRS